MTIIIKQFIIDYIPYIFLVIIIIYLILYSYVRLKYGFWFYQPVHHAHNFYYHFSVFLIIATFLFFITFC